MSFRRSKTILPPKKVTYLSFRGLMAPVFTCFTEDDQHDLKLQHIERYAKWLKSERLTGILVNSITGEGPALGLNERKINAEAWWRAALKVDMMMMIQIGGAPLPDVLELAVHAEELGVHAVLCLPELFYKPKNIEQLLGYCKIVAKKCRTRPFFYYHIPQFTGVDLNSITGEGPALGRTERMLQAEAWWNAVNEVDLMMMVQVGGAPLADVLELATHAEKLGVHAVLCIPELFYRPQKIEQLISYCKMVAKKCHTRPFFYDHLPILTGAYFDMAEFCQKAEESIPNFFGLQYSSNDLDMGSRCLREGRVVMLGTGTLLASGMMLGFESALLSVLNIRPDLGWEIYNAMMNNDMPKAKEKQRLLCELIRYETRHRGAEGWVPALKNWFNKEMFDGKGAGFSAGPARKFF